MFGIPGEVFWPTAAIGTLIALIFGGFALLRLLPPRKSGAAEPLDRQTLEELQARLEQLDQLQERLNELEERVDFAERILAKRHESQPPRLPSD